MTSCPFPWSGGATLASFALSRGSSRQERWPLILRLRFSWSEFCQTSMPNQTLRPALHRLAQLCALSIDGLKPWSFGRWGWAFLPPASTSSSTQITLRLRASFHSRPFALVATWLPFTKPSSYSRSIFAVRMQLILTFSFLLFLYLI